MKIYFKKLSNLQTYIFLNALLIHFAIACDFYFEYNVTVCRASNTAIANFCLLCKYCSWNWINVQSVILSKTDLQDLSGPAFYCLINYLKHLDISKNRIKDLPPDIFRHMSKMKHLDFSSNLIEALPEGIFEDCVMLETIYGHSNMIQSLPVKLFLNSINLKEIRFDNNRLEKMDKRVLANLTLLLNLNLNHNKLRSIHGILPEHRKIQMVDIAYRDISKLKTLWQNRLEVFVENNEITLANFHIPEHVAFLGLRGNRLESFPIAIREQAARTSDFRVTLSENPWTCDCSVLPLKNFLSEYRDVVADIGEVRCKSGDNTFVLAEEHNISLCFSVAFVASGAVALTAIMVALIICYVRNCRLPFSLNCCKMNASKSFETLVEEEKSKGRVQQQMQRY